MRLPNLEDLTDEQRNVYMYAPLDENILVAGPPGSGKTLIAYLRGGYTQKKDIVTSLVMYNNVLQVYTRNIKDDSLQLQVTSINSWFANVWQTLGLPAHKNSSVYLTIPYSKKSLANNVRARWVKYKKQWKLPGERYLENESELEKYYTESTPPYSDQYSINWKESSNHCVQHAAQLSTADAQWGHLIIDEGQDFPPDFYTTITTIDTIANSSLTKQKRPRVTVFADQNQRITKDHSLLKDIRENINIDNKYCYFLYDNFRNTKPIALLANFFEVDSVTGTTRIPQTRGRIPELLKSQAHGDELDFITRYITNNLNKEIAIIVKTDKRRKSLYNKLSSALSNSTVTLQTYSSKDDEYPANDLCFDQEGHVTVLCHASCKGLEFDTVFLLDLEKYNVECDSLDFFKMELFVATSRARSQLYLVYTNTGSASPEFLKHMPDEKLLKRRTLS